MIKWFNYVSGYMLKWFLFATFMGLGGGASAIVLYRTINGVELFGNLLPIWLAPAIGGAIVCLIYYVDRDAMGLGTNRYITSINIKSGAMKKKTFITKMMATAVTLGFKGSGGVEGPMVIIGGSLANSVSSLPLVRSIVNVEDRRIMTICGAAGAVGAIFRSPLGGGIFVVEVLYKSSLHYNELFPAILSSTIGYAVFSMFSNGNPLFYIPDYTPNMLNIPFFILSGVLAGVVALVFMWFFERSVQLFRKYPYARRLRPIIGGLCAGLVFISIPKASGIGIDTIQQLISGGALQLNTLVLLLIGKVLATSFTVGSDGSAGLVIPALFLGAVCGNMMMTVLRVSDAGFSASLVISGMAASLASIANVPVAASVLIVEMVGLRHGVPATIGSIVGYVVGHSKVIYDTTHIEEKEFEFGKMFRKRDRRFEH